MKKWWIGCSGFYYKGWKEKFYPKGLPQRKWFEHYCESFNTVELNATFYRFPRVEALREWYDRSPAAFRFAVKAPRLITHYRRFRNARKEANTFYDRVSRGLKDKLGCVLFQLHPSIKFTEENLDLIIETLDTAYTNAVEFRHESWWSEKVYKSLKEHEITFCSISYPGLPDEVLKTASSVYYRFHGVPELYLSSYSDKELNSTALAIKRYRNVKEVYCYFNNDIEVFAVKNARTLITLV